MRDPERYNKKSKDWNALRFNETHLTRARLMVEADLREKAAANELLTRTEKIVATALGGKTKFGFGAAPAAGFGAPGAVGGGAGGIPIGGGERIAAGAAAAGGYGHGYGYASGVGIGGGIGAGVMASPAAGAADLHQHVPGLGMRGNGVPVGQLAGMYGAFGGAIGGAPNLIPPSPAAAGVAGAGGGVGNAGAADASNNEEAPFSDAEIRFLLEYNAQQMAYLRREHDEDKNQQLAGATRMTEVQDKMLQQMQRMDSDAQRNQNQQNDFWVQQNEVNANLLGEIKTTQQMHVEYQANHAAYHEEEDKKRDAEHNELAGRTTNLEGQVGGLQKMFKEKFGIGPTGGEDAGAIDSTATSTPFAGSSVAPGTLKNPPVATADVCVGTAEETNEDDSKMPPSDLSGTNMLSNQAPESAAAAAAAAAVAGAGDPSRGGDNDTLVVGSISYANTSAAPLSELEKWSKERSIAEGNKIKPIVITRLLHQYVQDHGINSTMRQGAPSIQQQNFSRSLSVALIALKPYPFRDHWVYRSIRSEKQEFVLNFKDLMERGEPFVEPGLLSACALSFDMEEKKNYEYYCRNTYFAIRSKSGRLIRKYSQQPDEWEVLFAAGTSFRILSFEDTTPGVEHGKSNNGRYKIVMEEIASQIWGL